MENYINLWDNIKSQFCQHIQIQDWLELIKNSTYKSRIDRARTLGKSHPEYSNIKHSLPAATLNFSFHNKRQNSDICCSTGFLYLDFDTTSIQEAQSLKEQLSTSNYTYACWLSLSQLGVGALVKVECLSLDSFKEQYLEVCKDLGLDEQVDVMAIKATQPNVLSSDPNIYINTQSLVKKCNLNNIKKTQLLYYQGYTFEDIEIPAETTFNKLVWKLTLPEEEYEGRDVVFKEATYFEAYWPFVNKGQPKRIHIGERNGVFSALINNLRILNPTKEQQVLNVAKYFNNNYCTTPLPFTELQKMVTYAYSRQLQPIGAKTKITWVNPNCTNKKVAIGKAKQEISINLIELYLSEALCNNKKITATSISKATGLSRKTIHKYLPLYNKEINEFNSNLKKV